MPFFIILTSIPSIKVVFFKNNRLANRARKGGKDKRRSENEE
jgi:hypothetical protein